MKNKASRMIISTLFAFVMVIGTLAMSALTVHAVDVSGTVNASSLTADSSIVLTGATTLVMDQDLTLSSISGAYDLTVQGNGTLSINSRSKGIDVGSLTCNSNLTVQAEDIAINAHGNVTINCTTLDVTGHGGMIAQGDINITAKHVAVLAQTLSCIESSRAVSINSDVLRLENASAVNDPNLRQHGIFARTSINVDCPDATIFACDIAVYGCGCDVTLTGNFTIIGTGSFGDGIMVDGKSLYLNGGQFSVSSNVDHAISAANVYANCYALSVKAHGNVKNKDYSRGILAGYFLFDGNTLTVASCVGVNANIVDITAESVIITTDVGDAIKGDEIYVTANYIWAENKAEKTDSTVNEFHAGQHGINAVSKLSLTVKGGTVLGYDNALNVVDEYNEFDTHEIYVKGSITFVSRIGEGMYVPAGTVRLYGGPIVSVGEGHGIYANDVVFVGNSLTATGNAGIYAKNSVELRGDDIQITAYGERNSGISSKGGNMVLEGKVNITTSGWFGINAGADLTLEEGYFEISGPKGNTRAILVGGNLYMDNSLQIAKPTNGRVSGSDIYGEGNLPALEVLIYSTLSDISLYVNTPREGALPAWTAAGIYRLDPRCTVEDIVWYEDGVEMSRDAKFIAGRSYSVKITICADGNCYFAEGIMAKVNDKSVSTGLSQQKTMYLTADLGNCPKTVDTVELTIKAPVEGNAPSTGVSDPSSEYGVYSRDVQWSVSTDGINFVAMANGETFTGGKYYRVFMDVNLAGKDYKFPITTADGTVQPDVTSYVNGSPAKTIKVYDQDPSTTICVYFDFGLCNERIIKNVEIVNLVLPTAGKTPSYTANTFGTGYGLENSEATDHWTGKLYKKNGIIWYDEDYNIVYADETFKPGKTYRVRIYLDVTDTDNYVFDYNDSTGESTMTATINGYTAEAVTEGSNTFWNQNLWCDFVCAQQEISTVRVNDLDEPTAGETPDYTATVTAPDSYQLDPNYGTGGMIWYDCEDNMLTPTDTFRKGEQYKVEIKLIPVQIDGVNVCKFVSPLSAFINNKEVSERLNWDNVYVSNNAVYLYYTFIKGASAPEAEGCQASKVPGFAANCAIGAAGMREAYFCLHCGKYYEDEACTKEITDYATWKNIPPVHTPGPAATATTAQLCTVCGTQLAPPVSVQDGWVLDNGIWYYYENGSKVTDAWRKDSTGWCYLLSDGSMATDMWLQDSKGWCYIESSGYCATNCWKQDSIGWVWLDSEGSMVKSSWIQDNGKWYYLDENGYMVRNQWRKDSIGWCYLLSDGSMATDMWLQDSKGWCYVESSGYCATSCWKQDSTGWVWLDSEGSMVYNRWILDGGCWYYVGSDGYMLLNTTWNGYHFNASGVCTNP